MPVYSKTTWVDGTTPAISAANLNKLEQGVFDSIRQDGSTTMSAQLITIAGTAATPAIAPTGDSNTGIFFPSADTIAFGEGGAEAMRITSAGNVGIGVTPSVKLHVKSAGELLRLETTAATGDNFIRFYAPSAVTKGYVGYTSAANDHLNINNVANSDLLMHTNDTERMRITSTGNVGIGTNSPASKIEVMGDTTIRNSKAVSANSITRILGGAYTSNLATLFYFFSEATANNLVIGGGTSVGEPSSNIRFHTGTVGATAAGTERMRIDTNGYLLVGYTTSNGAYPLQVNGQIFATSSTIATSDGRYKKDIVSIDGALDIVSALNPVQFNWKEHPVHKFNTEVPTIGFIAQEVAEVLKDKAYLTSVIKKSECTWETETGEIIEREVTRDVETQVEREVIEEVDGEEIARTITETVIEQVTETVTEPVKETHTEEFYGIAESNMIAILTKAIQELKAEVDALKAQLVK
jgi:hypothetical protein